MIVGEIIKMQNKYYVCFNKEGSLEKLPDVKWYCHLFFEIISGLNIYLHPVRIREICKNHKK